MPDTQLTQLTSEIVAAFVERNRVEIASLPDLIRSVHGALSGSSFAVGSDPPPVKRASTAEVRRSITNDALISFEDGRPYRMLKRHLRTVGLTPEEYRAKWGLPADHPMVAPTYSARRSEFAKASGLGVTTRRNSGTPQSGG
ncbi:MucR family transcriptional regulator [Phenylobacterium sp. LjRoot219]|uniref:MucR family transcriptional regulator n=1 Tax=Phenylobacterium sp. LjRoot219 TaxID=3342283 RepID=UPI003ED07FB5